MKDDEKVMQALLELWDWHRRFAGTGDDDDYQCGYADAIGQCILNIGKSLGCNKWSVKKQDFVTGYKYEAYKRVVQDTTLEEYWKRYPTPIASYFPAEVTQKYGGTL